MSLLSDVVNVGSLGIIGDGPFSGSPSQSSSSGGGTITPSMKASTQRSLGLTGNVQDLFGPQAQLLSQNLGYAGDLLNQFRGNPQSLVAGFNPLETLGQASAIGATQPIVNQAQQAFGQALQTDPTQNPFFQSALQSTLNPFIRNFQQQVLPGIRSQAIGVGQPGGSREGIAQGLASQGLLEQLGNIAAQMGSQAFGQGLTARQGALGLAPQLGALSLLPSQTLMDIGQQQRGMEQQRILSPFTLAQQIKGLAGAPTVLGRGFGLDFGGSDTRSIGEVREGVTSSSTGATPGLLEQISVGIPIPS